MKVSRSLIALVCLIGLAAHADDEKDKEKREDRNPPDVSRQPWPPL